MSSKGKKQAFRLEALDARVKGLELNRSKLLVGSDERCDLVIKGRGVSPQHCYLLISTENIHVMDLASTNGTFINGKRIKDGILFPDDTLTLADLAFGLVAFEQEIPLIDCEAEVELLVNAVSDSFVQVPDRAGLTLIDQEYCDLALSEDKVTLVKDLPFEVDSKVVAQDELETLAPPLDLVESHALDMIEVVVYSSGNVIDIHFVDISKKPLILSCKPGRNKVWFPGLSADLTLLGVGAKSLKPMDGFVMPPNLGLTDKALFLTHGVHQLSLRLVGRSFKVRPMPFMWRDRQFYKEAMKIAGGVFLPFLLLLFVTLPELKPEPAKQITIVYKAVKQADGVSKAEISATEVTSQTENTGQKKTEQPKSQPQMASSSAASKSEKTETAAGAAGKTKAYEFKSSVSVDSVVADAAPASTGAGRSPAAVGKGVGASASALGHSSVGSNVGVGRLGSDSSGTAGTSTGAKGLVSKKGFDHSYLEPKTVVLGSMDPEVLRKILQEYLPQFRHCYQQELVAASAEIKGVIDLDFQIDPDGKVSKTSVKAKDARFTKKGVNCMTKVLSIIEFPKPKGGGVVDVRQPLNFFAETEKM